VVELGGAIERRLVQFFGRNIGREGDNLLPNGPSRPLQNDAPGLDVGHQFSLWLYAGQSAEIGGQNHGTVGTDFDDGGHELRPLAGERAVSVLLVRIHNHKPKASDKLLTLFGDKGKHTRVAVAVPEMPLDAPVQLAVWVEV
jgi:hypothetical protein